MRSTKPRGMTLIELMVAGVCALFIGAALFTFLQTGYQSQAGVQSSNQAYAAARQCMDTLADHLRNAQVPAGGTAVLSAAAESDISYYADSSGSTVRYWLDTGSSSPGLKRADSTGTSLVLSGVQSLAFTYYVNSGLYYTTAASSPNNWPTTADPENPTAAEMPNVAAIGIVATVTTGGYSRQVSSFVRLRNSPVGKQKV